MGSRSRPARTRPIQLTLAVLLVLPLISLVALWGFAASVTLGQAVAKRNYDTQNRDTRAASTALLTNLVQERTQAFVWVCSDFRTPPEPLDIDNQRQRTNVAVAAFRRAAAAAAGVLGGTAKQDLPPLLYELGQLGKIRSAIDSGSVNALTALEKYNAIVDAEFRFLDGEALIDDISLYRQAEAHLDAVRALDMAAREAALAGGALAAGSHMTEAERALFIQAIANQRFLESQALSQLDTASRTSYEQLFASRAYTTFRSLEDRIAANAGRSTRITVDPRAWQSGAQSFMAAFLRTAYRGREAVSKATTRAGDTILLRLILAGGAGLVAVVASIFLLLRFGHRITRELKRLHEAARTLAEDRLPRVVSQLAAGAEVDAEAEVPAVTPAKTREIAVVARAFATVGRTAVEAAVGQANLRKGVSQVFLNLARRNQSLLHRQLDLIDSMERTTTDPQALESFFRLDHLTTRMRRHAESLIILSGEPPGRGWRQPVPVVDVIRGAVSEVEDYVRVDVTSEAPDAIAGAAVADIIHLLAELIENATCFSPPNTRVTVSAGRVGNGFVVEIEDRGLGMDTATLAEINERLAHPPEFDLADSDQLGLFVVSQLAARHRIRVSLRESPFGGTTAIVLMPHPLVTPEDSPEEPVEIPLTWIVDGGKTAPLNRDRPLGSALGPAGAAGDAAAGAAAGLQQQGRADAAPSHLGLPRRVRQANLAPELRDGAYPAELITSARGSATGHSPEQTRARMTSMQRAWERGRAEQADPGVNDVANGIAAAPVADAWTGTDAAQTAGTPAGTDAAHTAATPAGTDTRHTADIPADTDTAARTETGQP